MLLPKKVKHRKWQKKAGTSGGKVASRKTRMSFGAFGLKAVTEGWITSRQIESARRAMTRFVQRGGTIWIRVFPDKPVTAKGNEIPMGGGKGAVDHYVVAVKPGTILFEMDGVAEKIAKQAMGLAAYKLPVRTKFTVKYAV
jgi:large subunit ribosomal protein L16